MPAYASLFGPTPYVRNAEDPQLLKLVTVLLDQAPELKETPLAQDAALGRLERQGIEALQRFLEAKGHSVGRSGVDGLYGPLTHQALKSFLDGASAPADERPDNAQPATTVAPLGAAPTPVAADVPPHETATATPEAVVTSSLPVASSSLRLPPRPPQAPGGSALMAQLRNLSAPERERALFDAIMSGNVPDFLRRYKTLNLSFTDAQGTVHQGQVQVLPDYLAVGSDQDFVRVPLSPLMAQRIADRLEASLPTRKLVDTIYQQADVRVAPSPLPAGPQMTSVDYALRHQQQVDRQTAGMTPGPLMAGHKKDVVLSNQLDQHPGRVAIYGWHQSNGKVIQGLSTVHEATYSDYSHGIRLVGNTVRVDGVDRPLQDILQDPVLSRLLSDEGVLRRARYPTA